MAELTGRSTLSASKMHTQCGKTIGKSITTILQTVDLLLFSKMMHCTDENTSQQTQLLEKNNAKIIDKNLQKSINQSINQHWLIQANQLQDHSYPIQRKSLRTRRRRKLRKAGRKNRTTRGQEIGGQADIRITETFFVEPSSRMRHQV